MRTRELLSVVTRQLEDCSGYRDGDETAAARELALNYYFMRARGDEIPGRSRVVAGDVSAMVDAVHSQMLDAFTNDNIVSFDAENGEDEYQSALETDAVTYTVMDGNSGFISFSEAIKDALLHDTGVIKVWFDDSDTTRERVFRNVTPEAYAELIQERPGIRLEKIEWKKGVLRYSELRSKKRVMVDCVAPENFFRTANWHSRRLDTIPAIGERMVETRGALSARGFQADIVAGLSPYVETGSVSTARNRKRSTAPRNRSADPSLDVVEWFELYPLIDNERRKVCFVPNKAILRNEPAAFIPYASGSAILNPHRLDGVSIFTKVKQTQDSRTGLKRALHDNARAANKNRTIYLEGKVSQEDLEDGRVDGNIGISGAGIMDVRQAVGALVVPDISAGILANLENEKRDRAELGGASLDLASGQAQIADRVGSQGVDRMYSVMEQLAGTMTRTIAETLVRPVYELVHCTLREYVTEPITLKRAGKWVSTNPKDWPERRRLTVKVGMSPGERQRKVSALTFLLNTQFQLGKEGLTGVLVTMQTFYALLMDWCRASEVDNSERYYLDPSSDESQKAQAARAQTAQAEKAAQQRLMDMALGLEQLRVSLDKRDKDAQRVLEYFKTILDAEIKEAEIVGNATTQFELAKMQAEELSQEQEHTTDTLGQIDRAVSAIKALKNGQDSAA